MSRRLGKCYDQQHSDTQMQAYLALKNAARDQTMNRYLARVDQRFSGDNWTIVGYLSRGKTVRVENATRYCHPSAAKAALAAYAKRNNKVFEKYRLALRIVDTRCGEGEQNSGNTE